MSEILELRKIELKETVFKDCIKEKDYEKVYFAFLKEAFRKSKMHKVLFKLDNLLNSNLTLGENPTNQEVIDISKKIEEIVNEKDAVKDSSFSGLDFLAMSYVYMEVKNK